MDATEDRILAHINHCRDLDAEAMTALVKAKVPCNERLALYLLGDRAPGEPAEIGLLTVLNGMNPGPIYLMTLDHGRRGRKFVRFGAEEAPPPKPDPPPEGACQAQRRADQTHDAHLAEHVPESTAGESPPPGPEWRSRGVTRDEVCAALNVDPADLQQEIDRQRERDRLAGIGRVDFLAGGKGRKRARKLLKCLKRIADTLDAMVDKHERLFREVLEIREGTLSLAGSLLAKNDALYAELRRRPPAPDSFEAAVGEAIEEGARERMEDRAAENRELRARLGEKEGGE